MDFKSKNIQQQYQGYLRTPLLWKGDTVFGLQQLKLPAINENIFSEELKDNLLLGKRVERFVSSELNAYSNIQILLENTQINYQKITIGELDCILTKDNLPIHLEIIYKFYLYVPNNETNELAKWIGPNKKDSLLKKLQKLRDKQLPLLHHLQTKTILERLGIIPNQIQQRVLFKAQLYIPYQSKPTFEKLNPECLSGFYIPFSEVEQFSECKFYIPLKKDWLLEVQTQVPWVSFSEFYQNIEAFMKNKIAPLCWIKFPKGSLNKFFITWW